MGILVASFPCGVITVFEELYGSESLTQVYAIIVEYLAALPKNVREEIIEILYDDACHFKKFSEKKEHAEKNDVTEFLATKVGKHVDKFHFPNHVDKWCHQNCNPNEVKHLEGVNTPICEQLFSAINKFTNAKAMNESHFFLFFLFIFDLHNLNIEGKLRSIANPCSEHRDNIIKALSSKVIDEENSKCKDDEIANEIDEVEILLESLTFDCPKEAGSTKNEFVCQVCNASYKKEGNLKNHLKKKHPVCEQDFSASKVCTVCGIQVPDEKSLKTHMSIHYKCEKCGSVFEELKYLNRHMKSAHSPIDCDICGETCSDKGAYSIHLNIHLKCEICGKVFDKLHKIKRHMLSHK